MIYGFRKVNRAVRSMTHSCLPTTTTTLSWFLSLLQLSGSDHANIKILVDLLLLLLVLLEKVFDKVEQNLLLPVLVVVVFALSNLSNTTICLASR